MLATARALALRGASLEEQQLFAGIAADEIQHAEWSMALADRFGGYEASVPLWFPYALSDRSEAPERLEIGIALEGMVSEVISLSLLEARVKHARAGVLEIVRQIQLDEAVHVAIARHFGERMIPRLDRSERAEIGAETAHMIEEASLAFAGIGRDDEVEIRRVTAEAGLGAAPPEVAKTAIEDAIADRILPSLSSLGVMVPPRIRSS